MPTRDNGGVQAAVHDVADRTRTLARLEVELATLELRQKVAALGAGAVLLAVGALLGLYALGFLFATVAAALATVLATWLAILIVGGVLLLVALVTLAVGRSRLRRGMPPVPKQAITEAKLMTQAIQGQDDG